MMQNNDACFGWLNGRNDRIRKNCLFLKIERLDKAMGLMEDGWGLRKAVALKFY